jgi:UDP-glucose 4-epimerase
MYQKDKVLVTGASGYIGSHIVKQAYDAGYEVHTLDNGVGNELSDYSSKHFTVNIRAGLNLPQEHYKAVIHCAALISVEESTRIPKQYYETNVIGTVHLLNELNYDHFVFASTGAAFDPVSPYAKSKLIAEEAVRQMAENYSIFRFFNVAGNNGIFQQTCTPSHIIHIAAQAAAGKRDKMVIFGNDYDTLDGTCIRDYVHVVDLADALVRSINTPANTPYECVGSGAGYSNLEVVNTMKRISGVDFPVEFGQRRAGDPSILKVDTVSKYVIINHTLEDMCRSAYATEIK